MTVLAMMTAPMTAPLRATPAGIADGAPQWISDPAPDDLQRRNSE